jgi:P-type conjugative transfer protein TrbJ
MKRLRILFAGTAFATSLAIGWPVSADLPVIDISNLKQSILTAANTLNEVSNQITQIQQFVQMLENEARNLLSLPFSALQQITSAIDQVNSLMRQAQSLAYDVARIDQQFQQLFPSYSGNITQAKLISDARARWQASVDTFKHTMEVQSRIVSDIQADEATLSTLVNQSQGASGALQGIQSTNQLLALQSRQLGSTQALLSANARAQATETMRRAEVEEAARAEWQRFWGNGVSYTSAPVQVFGGAAP